MKHLLLSALLLATSAFAKVDPTQFENQGYSDTKFDIDMYEQMQDQRKGTIVPIGPVAVQGRGAFLPFDLDKASMLKIAAASAVAVVFFANDKEIMNFAQENKIEFADKIAYVGEALGSEWGLGLTGAGYIIGIVLKDNKVKTMAIMATKAMLVSGLATQAIKHAVDRTRPKNSDDPYEYGQGGRSFPSGHTTQAFALATVIAESTKDQSMIIPVLAYSAAAIAGWSRVNDRAHWASDVVIGGLIGHLTAKAVMNSKMAEKGIMIIPEVGFNGSAGFRVTYTGKQQKMKCGEGLEDIEAFRDCIEKSFQMTRPINLF